jgi:hypothetical protein
VVVVDAEAASYDLVNDMQLNEINATNELNEASLLDFD